jgi:hypothetical protein
MYVCMYVDVRTFVPTPVSNLQHPKQTSSKYALICRHEPALKRYDSSAGLFARHRACLLWEPSHCSDGEKHEAEDSALEGKGGIVRGKLRDAPHLTPLKFLLVFCWRPEPAGYLAATSLPHCRRTHKKEIPFSSTPGTQ